MPRDWNEGSDSEDQSDNEYESKISSTPNEQKIQQNSKQIVEQSQKHQQKHTTQPRQQRQRPKFLSDEELIQKIKKKEIEERQKIKVVKCFSQELLETIKNHALVSYFKQIKIGDKPAFYILSFKSEEDLIKFIQEKIQNRYRFFFQPYIKSAKDIQRQKQRQLRRKQNQGRYQHKDSRSYNDRDNRRQDNRRQPQRDNRRQPYRQNRRQAQRDNKRDEKATTQKQRPKQVQKKTNRNRPQYEDQKQQVKPKQLTKASRPVEQKVQQKVRQKVQQKVSQKQQEVKQSFNYQIFQNKITISNNIYSKHRIVDDIIHRNVHNKWNKIRIYVKPDGLDKVLQLVEIFYQQIAFGLSKIPQDKVVNGFLEVAIEHKSHVSHPNLQFKLLTVNQKRYFQDISKNKFKIGKDFSIDEYVKGFKQHQKDICKKWKKWIIKAQADNIENLMKLSWILKRDFYLNIEIKVGSVNDTPFSILQINPQTDKEKRPKVDASFVNSYLTN